MEAVINGIIFGLTLASMIGPVFFTLLQTSLQKGFDKAILVALGVSLGDIFLIVFAYYGFAQFIDFENNKELIAIIGGIVLMLFGIFTIVKSKLISTTEFAPDQPRGFFRHFFKGLIINALSPFVPIFWIATMSLARIEYNYEGQSLIIFFTTIVIIVFVTDVIKAYLAHRLTRVINNKVIKTLNIIVGIILIAFGLRMLTYY